MRRFRSHKLSLFTLGGTLYCLIELLWRQRTHPSMFAAGGLCLVLLDHALVKLGPGVSLWRKCAAGAYIITAVEFMTGCVVNLLLGWNVWDYSSRPFHLMGQICLLYSGLWFLLSIPAVWLCQTLRRKARKV